MDNSADTPPEISMVRPKNPEKMPPAMRGKQTFVTIITGPEGGQETFTIPKSIICHYSPFLRAAFNGTLLEGTTQSMTLEDVDKVSICISKASGALKEPLVELLKYVCNTPGDHESLELFCQSIMLGAFNEARTNEDVSSWLKELLTNHAAATDLMTALLLAYKEVPIQPEVVWQFE
ncbi:hypothetical protein BDZ45DRAFT_754615 [Acephala macrosclerotiorum]|nr:hypothetical protein BDZ45DRAFT_754615 [Acephala macrosclerotiorum]